MTLSNKVQQFSDDADTLHAIVHGPAAGDGSTVDTDGGARRTLAKIDADLQGQGYVAQVLQGVTDAQAAKVAAQAARDAANTSSRAYTAAQGTAAALADAGVIVGQTFAVVSADSLSYTVYRKDAGPVATLMFAQYTKAYMDQVADLSADRYFQGKRVLFARMDTQSHGGDFITEDGQHYGKYALRGGNGIAIAPADDGFYVLSVGGAFDSLSFTGGNTMGGLQDYFYDGKKVVRAWGDSSSRASIVETEDGTVYVPKLSSAALDSASASAPLDASSHLFEVQAVAGKTQIFRTKKSSGARSQATAIGSNTAPRASSDGTKVIYSTDRNGAREGYYQLLDGSKFGGAVEHPVLPRKTIMPLGDSLTAGDYAGTVAATLGAALLLPSISEKCGIGSQTSDQISARYGAAALTCSLAGNAMQAGANVVTAISVQLLSRTADVNGTVRSLRASILGVAGTLQSTQSPGSVAGALPYSGAWYSYTFTPDAGQALPGVVPAATTLVIDPEDRQDSILLVWMGRNNVGTGAGWQTEVKNRIAEVFAAYKPLVRRICLLSITNATWEPAGSANYNDIVALNAELAALYPDSFVNVRPAYNAGTATDIPAAANTSDGLHYTDAGKAVIANVVSNFISAKGWFA